MHANDEWLLPSLLFPPATIIVIYSCWCFGRYEMFEPPRFVEFWGYLDQYVITDPMMNFFPAMGEVIGAIFIAFALESQSRVNLKVYVLFQIISAGLQCGLGLFAPKIINTHDFLSVLIGIVFIYALSFLFGYMPMFAKNHLVSLRQKLEAKLAIVEDYERRLHIFQAQGKVNRIFARASLLKVSFLCALVNVAIVVVVSRVDSGSWIFATFSGVLYFFIFFIVYLEINFGYYHAMTESTFITRMLFYVFAVSSVFSGVTYHSYLIESNALYIIPSIVPLIYFAILHRIGSYIFHYKAMRDAEKTIVQALKESEELVQLIEEEKNKDPEGEE